MSTLPTRIYLLGFMGCGKTRVGTALARDINYRFIDLDESIEEKTQQTIAEIFEEGGEARFREIEGGLLREVSQHDSAVIALGGGTPCREKNLQVIHDNGVSIYLEVSPSTLVQRLQENEPYRPLIADLSAKELPSFIRHKLSDRSPYYEQADFTVNGELPPKEVARQIHTFLSSSS